MKITIDGKDHDLDVPVALKNGCLKPVEVHRIGNHYSIRGNFYILAEIDHHTVGLINIQNGNRWDSPRKCEFKNVRTLSQQEFESVVGGKYITRGDVNQVSIEAAHANVAEALKREVEFKNK